MTQSLAQQAAHLRERQIDHITEAALDAFQELTARDTVEEYFDEFTGKWEDPDELYLRLCSDLELDPVEVS